jgi:hypothetical protein
LPETTVYFWPDPVRVLAEVRLVLRSDGFRIIAGIDSATAAAVPFYRAEYGFSVRDADALIAFHRKAGFTNVEVEPFDEITKMGEGRLWRGIITWQSAGGNAIGVQRNCSEAKSLRC